MKYEDLVEILEKKGFVQITAARVATDGYEYWAHQPTGRAVVITPDQPYNYSASLVLRPEEVLVL